MAEIKVFKVLQVLNSVLLSKPKKVLIKNYRKFVFHAEDSHVVAVPTNLNRNF